MEPIFTLRNISYSYYGRYPALIDIDLEVAPRTRVAVIGSNGSGKSTLFQIMAALITPDSGEIGFQGLAVNPQSLKDASFVRAFRQSVGYVFQDADIQLFCPTVMDELIYGPLHMGLPEAEAIDRAHAVMSMLGMEGLGDRPSHMLSGGQKKRVSIGSVLTMNPDVLLLDEPTNGLDPKTQCFLIELMLSLGEAGKTIMIATHDLSLVDELDARVVVINEAHSIEKTGTTAEILGDEELLLKVNLIHEHRHMHGKDAHVHRHSHFFFHKH